jgi:hypothetical protein
VSAAILDAAGVELAQVEAPRWRRARAHTLTFDGAGLADGAYTLLLRARSADGTEATASAPVTISTAVGHASVVPAVISPNGDGRADVLRAAFTLPRRATVTVRAVRDGSRVATLFSGPLAAGRRAIRWDGAKTAGTVGEGRFELVVEAEDGAAVGRAAAAFAVDLTPPRLRLVSRVPPRLAVSEAAALRVRVNGALRRVRADGPGTLRLPGVREIRTLQADAWDAAGNAARTLRVRRPSGPAK